MAEGTGMIGAGDRPETHGLETRHPQVEGEARTSQQVRGEIGHTRADMSQTMRAIKGRFSSEYLKAQAGKVTEQATEVVRGAAVGRVEGAAHGAKRKVRGVSTMVVDTIKAHPIPAVLTLLGIAWLANRLR
jgi:hypothetical protein